PGRGECGNRRLCDFQALVGTVESLPLAFHRSHNASFPRPSFCQKVERTFLVSPETQSVAHRFCYRAKKLTMREDQVTRRWVCQPLLRLWSVCCDKRRIQNINWQFVGEDKVELCGSLALF